jgi:hypothetical protein
MSTSPLSKSVRSIVVLTKDSSGVTVPVMLYERTGPKKKKGTRILRPFETATRQLADATERYAQSYADRHRSSNRKKRDGWLRDLNANVARAASKGSKRLKISRMLMP